MRHKLRSLLPAFGFSLLLLSAAVNAHAQDFTDTWNTVTAKGESIVLTLRQTGFEVRGGYSAPNGLMGSDIRVEGLLKGNVKGDTLRFSWREEGSRGGTGRFTLSSDGQSFQGSFNATRNPEDTSGGTWNGTRRHSFAGVWQGKLGGGFLEIILRQSDDRVTGQLKVNSAEFGMIKDAVVVGRTLRFVVMRMVIIGGGRVREEYVGTGELVMDNGGKSFQGNINGNPANGTLVAR